ncbi:MAG: GNAT family N-acetyltransferase [Chloroflexi bacterium]|nr:GNAT family N-acetyltransferase [Chloroflexota bacterium]
MFPEVQLTSITRVDVARVEEWLNDAEVNSSWYGVDQNGIPLHIGYSPHEMRQASDDEWQQVFQNEDRKILSVYTREGDHIGEGQLVIEWPLLEAQLFLLVGRKDLWHHHYGTAALILLLDEAFDTCQLHRVWVDVPEYNEHALEMFRHLGFVLEGHLRGTHRKNDEWYDSMAMGLLSDEYSRRRARVLGNPAA